MQYLLFAVKEVMSQENEKNQMNENQFEMI